MANETVNVILKLVTGQYQREARQAAAATAQIGTAAANTSTHASGMASTMGVLSAQVKAAAVAFVAFKAVDFLGDSVSAASELEESINAVNKVFGTASGTIENFGQVTANAVGLSTREFNELATVTGSMLSNFGFNAQQAAAETIKLTQRAADMGSVFNTDVNDVLVAVNAALRGESEPIRKFGVSLDDATVRAKAVELGLAATSGEVDNHGKAVARLAIIYEQTSKTQGDFAATSDDLANAQRRATAAMENAQARLGKVITPLAANLIDRFAEGVERIAAAFGDEAAKKSIIFQEAMKGLNDEMAAGTLGTEDLANSLLHLAANSDLTASDFMTLAGAVGLTEDQWGIFADSLIAQAKEMGVAPEVIAELEDALRGVAGAAGAAVAPTTDAAAALVAYGSAADRAARKGQAVASAQRAITQALLEAANPAFAAASALDRLRSAQDSLKTAQEDGESSAQDIAAAQLNVAMTVTATVVTTFVDRGSAAAGDGSGRTYPGGRQHGGPVWSGQPYIVGEAGPELFIPQRSGMILPSSRMAEMGSMSWGGGNMTTINVESPMRDFRTDLQYATIVASVTNMVEQV